MLNYKLSLLFLLDLQPFFFCNNSTSSKPLLHLLNCFEQIHSSCFQWFHYHHLHKLWAGRKEPYRNAFAQSPQGSYGLWTRSPKGQNWLRSHGGGVAHSDKTTMAICELTWERRHLILQGMTTNQQPEKYSLPVPPP